MTCDGKDCIRLPRWSWPEPGGLGNHYFCDDCRRVVEAEWGSRDHDFTPIVIDSRPDQGEDALGVMIAVLVVLFVGAFALAIAFAAQS